MKDGFPVIDSDLHVIETGEIYENYLDEKYRDKIPRYLGLSPTNFPHWEVEGQMIPPWARSADVVSAQQFLDAPTEHMYKPVRERGYDASSTLQAMDAEGIDVGVIYRTFAHMVVSIDDLEPAYATAYCAAFNDWLADYCRTNPKRLKPAAFISLHDPELAAAEARRAVEKQGHVGVVLLPMPMKDRYFHSLECDVLWKEIARLIVA